MCVSVAMPSSIKLMRCSSSLKRLVRISPRREIMRSVDSCRSQHFCLFLQTVFLSPKGFFFSPGDLVLGRCQRRVTCSLTCRTTRNNNTERVSCPHTERLHVTAGMNGGWKQQGVQLVLHRWASGKRLWAEEAPRRLLQTNVYQGSADAKCFVATS